MSFGYKEQLRLEDEGVAAGLHGKKREDCPYDKAIQPHHWNHWVFGCENAAGELETLRKGTVYFINERGAIIATIPVEEAILSGRWKPRYVTLDMVK